MEVQLYSVGFKKRVFYFKEKSFTTFTSYSEAAIAALNRKENKTRLLSKVTLGQSVPIGMVIYFFLKIGFAKEPERQPLSGPPATIHRGTIFHLVPDLVFSPNSFLTNDCQIEGVNYQNHLGQCQILMRVCYYIRGVCWG